DAWRERIRLVRKVRLRLRPVSIIWKRVEAVGQRAHTTPRPSGCGGREPLVVHAEEIHLEIRVFQHVPVGIDREPESTVLDRTPDWLALEDDKHGRHLTQEYGRRIRLDAGIVPRLHLALVHHRHDAVQSDYALFARNGHRDF